MERKLSQWRHAARRQLGYGNPLDRRRAAQRAAGVLPRALGPARHGYVVSRSPAQLTSEKLAEFEKRPGFAATFLRDGKPPEAGATLRQASFPFGSGTRTSYFAPDVGLVKLVFRHGDGSISTAALLSSR